MSRIRHAMFACFLIICFLFAGTHSGFAVPPGQPLWTFPGIEDINTFAVLPDIDGDGVHEVAVATYDAGASGDFIYVISGASSVTPDVIWSAAPFSGVSGGGCYSDFSLTVSSDLNGDFFPDLLLSTAWGSRSVIALDGFDGTMLWAFDTYDEPESGWIYQSACMPDRTGDGIPEVAFGVGSDNENGYLVDGSDGSLIWRYTSPLDAIFATVILPDINGDTVSDVLFCAGDYDDGLYAVSGAGSGTPATLWIGHSGNGHFCAMLGDDVDDDGLSDPVVGLWQANHQVRCVSAVDGDLIWSFDNGTYNYIMRLVQVSDVDGDGTRDIAVGSWERALRVISGDDGSLIWESWAGTTNGGNFWAVDVVPDVTGDGIDEVAGGSFDYHVYLFDGADGDTLWNFNTGYRLYSVRGTPDLSGTGGGDVMGGTQFLSSGGFAYALEGKDPLTGVLDRVAARGEAEFLHSDPGRVTLHWSMAEALPCHVYRIVETADKAAGRLTLAKSFEQGDTGAREVLDMIMAEPEAQVERLNRAPIEPSGLIDGRWRYRCEDALPGGSRPDHGVYQVTVETAPGFEQTVLRLEPRGRNAPRPLLRSASLHPNPFNPATWVHFELDRDAEVTLTIHDLRGRRVAAEGPASFEAGPQRWRWHGLDDSGRELPSGIYAVTLEAAGETIDLRAVLVR